MKPDTTSWTRFDSWLVVFGIVATLGLGALTALIVQGFITLKEALMLIIGVTLFFIILFLAWMRIVINIIPTNEPDTPRTDLVEKVVIFYYTHKEVFLVTSILLVLAYILWSSSWQGSYESLFR